MNTDFSRQRFDAANDFSGVLQQQGRVLLDAEWNEFNEIMDRRWRSETIDIIGRGIVPKQTPDGFKPVWDPATQQLTIGPGRIYVDGLLAENHGKAAAGQPLDFDAALSELRGSNPINYKEQRYYPNPEALPTGAGPHLIYVDVWQREVTNLEIPTLVEPAVGIDTTTRVQTAWQVRVLANSDGANLSCSTPDDQIPGWLDIIMPSAGRLTTAATGVPTADDPCLIPPTGGYRSLENRCYRVEIHSVDPSGSATFKWARDNRSMTAAIISVPAPNQITVDRVQWDSILRFSAGDWVEITDDWREFAGLPGIIAKISAKVDDSTRTITLSVNLSTTDFPLDSQHQPVPNRHMRIRKWDHSGIVRDSNGNVIKDLNADNAGVIPVKTDGTSILIEDGIQVTFSLAAAASGPSRFRVGDYWVFAARSADASIDILTAAPPRGVHHHYCRLGFITATGATDCRQLWPPDFGEDCCACTVCVTPDSHASGTMTLQQAIDKVKETGGTVCVAPGNYILNATLQVIGAKSVRLKGQGWQTVLVSVPSGEIPVAELAILIQDSEDFVVEDLAVTSSIVLDANQPIIGVLNSSEITIRHDLVVATATDLTRVESTRANFKGAGGIAVALDGQLQNIRVQENTFLTAVGVANVTLSGNANAATEFGTPMSCTGLQIDNNLLQCSLSGVRLQDTSVLLGPATVTNNFIIGCREAAVSVTGVVDSTVLSGSHFDAAGNTLRVLGDGIVIGVSEARVTGNDISTLLSGINVRALNAKIAGIALVTGASKLPLDRCQILANRLTRLVGNGVAIRGAVSSVMIKQNFIENLLGGGIVMEADSKTALLTIENNQITNVGNPTGTDGFQVVAGIFLANADQVEVAHNAIVSVGTKVTALSFVFGIAVLTSSKIKITGNRLVNIGPPDTPLRMAAGVFVAGSFENLEVSANHIRRANVPFTQVVADNSIWLALLIGGFERLNVHSLGDHMLVTVEHTHFLLGNATATAVSDLPEMATVHENMIDAYGIAVPIRIRVSGTCVFSDNQCRFKPAEKQSAVEISAGAIAMNSNFIENTTNAVAAQLTTGPTNYVVLGNITRGTILVNGAALGSTNIPLNASV